MQRRELFTNFAKGFKEKQHSEKVLRPPYFKDENDFFKECISCEDRCDTVCKEHIIKIEDAMPRLDFKDRGCTYCDECAVYCSKGVLQIENKKRVDASFEIDILQCLSWNGTMCFSCKDPCLDNAIDFIAMFRPSIDTTKCTSCGFCVGVCPTDAVKIK